MGRSFVRRGRTRGAARLRRSTAFAVTVAVVVGATGLAGGQPAPTEPPAVAPTSCAAHAPATGPDYDAIVSRPIGPWQAGDAPHQYALPDGRALWLWNDSFVNPVAPGGPITSDSSFVRNVAMLEDGACFTVLNPADADDDYGDFLTAATPGHWLWPLGGVVVGARLEVFLVELAPLGPPTWALNFDPVRTVIATFDASSLALLAVQAAPDAGIDPVYGTAAVRDGDDVYLFGNSLRYGDTASATYVARVPIGQLTTGPYAYWTGQGWSPNRTAARPVVDPGGYSYILSPQLVGNQWVAVTKADDFFGDHLDILGAPEPTGPWSVAATVPAPARPAAGQNTYGASALMYLRSGGRLIVGWSNNNFSYAPVATEPLLYRPTFVDVALPPALLHNKTRTANTVPPPRVVPLAGAGPSAQ